MANNFDTFQAVMAPVKRLFPTLAVFSLFVNLLLLASAIYMLQIYNRVLTSGSTDTLIWLTVAAFLAVMVYGLMEHARRLILSRIGGWLDNELTGRVVERAMEVRIENGPGEAGPKDVADLRSFFTSEGVLAFLDAPWSIIFLIFIWLLHPALGIVATIGALCLFFAALANDLVTRRKQQEVAGRLKTNHATAIRYIDSGETIAPLGMAKSLVNAWSKREAVDRTEQQRLSETTTLILNFSRSLRMLLQIAVLGIGAYFVLQVDLTPGAMIAAAIVLSRALAPIERSIGAWRQFVSARTAMANLKELFNKRAARPETITLPRPKGRLELETVVYTEPRTAKRILSGISFDLVPGENCAIIGPSGSGKSSLCRLLVGAWKPTMGHVRLDGADVHTWPSEDLGPYIGYLPQVVELFPGTVAQNIARFGELDSPKIIAAAKKSGVHDMILALPEGYESDVGRYGASISLGQKQRIALARALYDDPSFVVLDEPNSNLDSEGDQALSQALSSLKKNGATVVIVTHRPTALETADKVLILREGEMANFGEREQALRPTVSGAKFALKSRNTGKLKQTPKALDATAVKAE